MKKLYDATCQFLVLFVIALIAHFIVLRFIFPEHYTPFLPHHSDDYVAAHRAFANFSLPFLFTGPRPVGFWLLQLTGYWGTQVSLAIITCCIFVTAAMMAQLLRLKLLIPFDRWFLFAFAAFCFLLFAQNSYYVMATWDALATFSLLLLLLGLFSYRLLEDSHFGVALTLAFLFGLAAFLTKETYALAVLVLAFLIASSLRRAFFLMITLAASFVIGMGQNFSTHSFLSHGGPDSPYRIDLSPISIGKIMVEFAKAYSLTFIAIYLVLIGAVFFASRRNSDKLPLKALIALPVAGILSLVPNATLPNHVILEYSWVAAYFIFSVLITVCGLTISRVWLVSITAITVISAPLLFNYSRASWYIGQEARQSKLTDAVNYFVDQPGLEIGAKRILVIGITFPFSPFDDELSILQKIKNPNVRFDILEETQWSRRDGPASHWFKGPVDLSKYDQVWVIRDDGSAVFAGNPKDAAERVIIERYLPPRPTGK